MKNDKDYIFLIFCLKTSNSCEIRQNGKKCEKSIKKVFTLSFLYDKIKISSTKRKEIRWNTTTI